MWADVQYPVTATQWHPEKNVFEWATHLHVPHSFEAVSSDAAGTVYKHAVVGSRRFLRFSGHVVVSKYCAVTQQIMTFMQRQGHFSYETCSIVQLHIAVGSLVAYVHMHCFYSYMFDVVQSCERG